MEANTRKLVQRASSKPPPKAVLPMAEMVGIGRVERRVKVLRSLARNSATLQSLSASNPSDSTYKTTLLFRRHAQAFLQISSRAKGIVALTGDDQRPGAALSLLFMQAFDNTIKLG